MVNKFIRASVLALFMLLASYSIIATAPQAYATATPLPPPFSKFFYPSSSQFSGQPLAGGQVFTYTAGTTTPLASYTDSTALVQNSNPVILNSNGEANIWIAGAYKIIVEDPNGNVLSTTDNVQDLFTYDFIQSTSTTSLAIQSNATITLTTQAGKYYSPGLYLMVVNTAAPTTNWMHCQVTSYIGTQLMCATDSIGGSGTYAAWTISLSGPIGPQGPQGSTGSGAGDMVGADNLAVGAGGVANAATARANLGLGSAAVLNAGTGANQVVQLNSSAQYPAGNASLLTNLTGIPVVTNSIPGKIVFGAVTLQWGTSASNPSGTLISTFGTAFSGTPYMVWGQSPITGAAMGCPTGGWTSTTFACIGGNGSGGPEPFSYAALGPT